MRDSILALSVFCLALGGCKLQSVTTVTKASSSTSMGRSSASDTTSGDGSTGPATPPSPTPSSLPSSAALGTLDATCATNPNYDSCIFFKNPVAQNGAPLSPALSPTSNLDSLQIYGVKLAPTDGSGFLQNSSFKVYPSDFTDPGMTQLQRVKVNNSGNWKHPYSTSCAGSTCTADPNHHVGQLMAYFWLNYQKDFMLSQTGVFYASNKDIPVITYYPNLENAFWDGTAVVMGDGGASKSEFAMGAEIYLHEMGHANLDIASPSTLTGGGINCGGNVCCSTNKGCMRAIHEGQADYHAAIIFPANGLPMGETYINAVAGFSECGLTRNVGANKDTTASQAYSACASFGASGEVHLMGRVYASIWWEIRNKATSVPKEVDQLFSDHLKALQGSDNFTSALSKIKALDQNLFGGKYSQAFTDEFARRGI